MIIDILFDIFTESFIGLSSAFVPDKTLSEKARKIIKTMSAAVAVISMVCLVLGLVLLSDESGKYSDAGFALIIVFAVYFVIMIIANIIRLIKKYKPNKK